MSTRHGWFVALCLAAVLAAPARADQTPRRDAYGDPLPSGAIVRLGATRFRFNDLRGGIALSSDGKMLALGGRGG